MEKYGYTFSEEELKKQREKTKGIKEIEKHRSKQKEKKDGISSDNQR